MNNDQQSSVRKRLDVVEIFRKMFAIVPNTGEANDEISVPTAVIISEMCALRLENNNRLRR